MSLGKIFLSHSSKDKEYVGYIADKLGKDRCVYDEMCFEYGMKNLDEIMRFLHETDIFVWFISNNSLESDWVKREFIEANLLKQTNSNICQIFPVIIDENIKHDDSRIPNIISKGMNSYNIQCIKNNKIALKKIQAQFLRRVFENDKDSMNSKFFFYGRDKEIGEFKKAYDAGQGIKCLIASGLEGMGRKSYIIKVLHSAGIYPEYYFPFSISLNQNDQIEDLIIKLSDLGFGEYTLPQIVDVNFFDEKIDILSQLLQNIQEQREHVVIYDHYSIISYSRDVKFWFVKALENIRPEITISLLSSAEVNFSYLNSHKELFGIVIKELPYPEWNGLLRVYSEYINCPFDNEDRSYFKDILTGYPPQVRYCAELAKDMGIENIKKNAQKIIKSVSHKVVDILTGPFDEKERKLEYELLAFLSQYGTVPMKVIYDVIKICPAYEKILSKLKAMTVCRTIGYGEYLEVSPFVADYVQRNSFETSARVKEYLENQFENFYANIEKVDDEDFESLKYYLREAVMEGKKVPSRFLYGTLYLSSVKELYDKGKYKRVIEIMIQLKENGTFSRLGDSVQEHLQRYYCMALARETNKNFYTEIEWFREQKDFNENEYNFLRGFMFRQNGEFDKAIERYEKILLHNPNHRRALRELVASYRGLEDYYAFGDYAELNYKNDPDNPYNIQPYFEIILHKKKKTKDDIQELGVMLSNVRKIHKMSPIPTYYELNAQYKMYIESDLDSAISILNEGADKLSNSSYILRTLFDCYEMKKDIKGMGNVLDKLKKNSESNRANKISYQRRQIIFDAYNRKSHESIRLHINQLKYLTDGAKERLLKHVERILAEN